ncbi:sensor histidine kinase [candidate division WOR-3 bacterium]|nr:sensor histidine kinase [candidate division WOR-3 bacterium]
MEDLSLHILDIVENSIGAKASRIKIKVNEDMKRNLLTIEIKDNGEGMDKETIKKVLDPFYTTRTTRRVGLGLSLLAQATKESEGNIKIKSIIGKGTSVKAIFQYNHIDRKPLGDIEKTLTTLIVGNPEINFIYEHRRGDVKFKLDTKKARESIGV